MKQASFLTSIVHKMYGWYSPKQAEYFRKTNSLSSGIPRSICIYEDMNGNEVRVTEVTMTPQEYGGWGDYQPLGELKRFVRWED